MDRPKPPETVVAATMVMANDARTGVSPLEPSDPERLGPYRLLGRLGSGGMGVVFLGERPTGEPAAVKMVRPELAGQPRFRARFAREVAAAAHVRGRFTAPVVDSDVQAAQQWVATQYVPGPTLADYVEEHGPVAPDQARMFAAGLAEALHTIHAAGMVHRDLKPANVILSPEGPKVIDFGISQAADETSLTQTGAVSGSLAWMAPEQMTGADVGQPAVVFAWGLVIAYAALGRHPYGSGSPSALGYRMVHQQPDLAGIPEPLLGAVSTALLTDPGARKRPSELIGMLTWGRSGPDPASQVADAAPTMIGPV
jgi:eukaryotic-like serine/threonine-protein kinase